MQPRSHEEHEVILSARKGHHGGTKNTKSCFLNSIPTTQIRRGREMRLRVESTLPDDLESLIHETIGSCIEVHSKLGPGLLEGVYPRALALELDARGISHELEKCVPVRYRDQLIYNQRIDVLVDQKLILEIKSVERLSPVHVARECPEFRVWGGLTS
jgi:GxxExxY protein